ncbi:PhzF family phenazine biosynthesis protein [Paenibacillus sacheonensis]|uniref:PhzF family phenazine biosynthesis isomerase n=1 Tax=Paenibacillus sacheonensis TaxID=742054 RepID=A0A7X5BZ87_9BACL|nr:PhzF family phenazine biosynthesis protein [Paenibacillus sacheonensis]MBM7563677.1 PhzF family phenazine biosynthesis protein [Paenibacillus sacheonensis]NBC67965.1 PhzF family phenazine biosynthesis isomerase [Paenibacillus sacheonensis]
MTLAIAIIDAFTSEPFRGNPAAVCLLEEEREPEWMQRVAAEMNLSETAFLRRRQDGSFGLRWFTPTQEVDLCGHATLASSHYLWTNGLLDRERQARFYTNSGLLTATLEEGGIRLDFPAEAAAPVTAPEELIQGLGLIPRYTGRNRMDYLVEVDSEETVRTLRPDFGMLARVNARGVIVTSRAAAGTGGTAEAAAAYDFVSRAFYPATGVDEDPVTGSAHCALAPYWQKRLRKNEFHAYQASARGGEMHVSVHGERVHMVGQAVTVMLGQLMV